MRNPSESWGKRSFTLATSDSGKTIISSFISCEAELVAPCILGPGDWAFFNSFSDLCCWWKRPSFKYSKMKKNKYYWIQKWRYIFESESFFSPSPILRRGRDSSRASKCYLHCLLQILWKYNTRHIIRPRTSQIRPPMTP